MGDSDKLDIPSEENYSLNQHINWFDSFMSNLKLDEKVILVIHDWGSAIGFDYAKKYKKKNIRYSLYGSYSLSFKLG